MNLKGSNKKGFLILFFYFILCTGAACGYSSELHEAVQSRDIESVRELANNDDIDFNERDENGNAAMHIAAIKGYADIIVILSKAGADIDVRHRYGGMASLHLAAKKGHKDAVLALLDEGADPNAIVDNLSMKLFVQFITAFMDEDAEEVTSNFADHTPAYWASVYGHRDIVELLESAGSQPVESEGVWEQIVQSVVPSAYAGL